MRNLWLVVRSAFWAIVFPGTVAIIVPWRYFGLRGATLGFGDAAENAGLVLVVLGAALEIACIVEFARTGRGTLSAVDPPRELVVKGLYRYVRNPMYLSVSLMILGESFLLHSRDLLMYGAAFFVFVNLFVFGYEEPTLRRKFGASYEGYTRAVPRWWPRLRPWTPTP